MKRRDTFATDETSTALGAIDALLVNLPPLRRQEVIQVLTALRGPDNGSDVLKRQTTNWVRTAALPATCALDQGGHMWDVQLLGPSPELPDIVSNSGLTHFRDHIEDALRVLGWDV